jgi:hypothetical protein
LDSTESRRRGEEEEEEEGKEGKKRERQREQKGAKTALEWINLSWGMKRPRPPSFADGLTDLASHSPFRELTQHLASLHSDRSIQGPLRSTECSTVGREGCPSPTSTGWSLGLANATTLTDDALGAFLQEMVVAEGDDGDTKDEKPCFHHLWALDVSHCIYLTDRCLLDLHGGHVRLEVLDLTCCYELTSAALCATLSRAPGLRVLSLAGCSSTDDAVLREIAASCPCLVALDLAGLKEITDAGIQALVGVGGASWADCSGGGSGGSVRGSGSGSDKGRGHGHDRDTHPPGNTGAPLASIRLRQCTRLTDSTLLALATGSTAATLTAVDISWCDRLTDKGVGALRSLPQLKAINLTGCVHVRVTTVATVRSEEVANDPRLGARIPRGAWTRAGTGKGVVAVASMAMAVSTWYFGWFGTATEHLLVPSITVAPWILYGFVTVGSLICIYIFVAMFLLVATAAF